MPYTVVNPNGAKSEAYQLYSRMLRKQKVDLGKAPRTLEPGTCRRYLYIWDDREKAQLFAKEMKKRSGDREWEVRQVKTPVSEGPLGPIFIDVTSQSNGWHFSLHLLSQALLNSAYPQWLGPTSIFMDIPTWNEFQKKRGDLSVLAEQMATTLTGLDAVQLRAVGYVLCDVEKDQDLVFVAPSQGNSRCEA
jgi:hypothetical protein